MCPAAICDPHVGDVSHGNSYLGVGRLGAHPEGVAVECEELSYLDSQRTAVPTLNGLIACDLANPDFVRFAESFGARAERARTPQELRSALKRAFASRDGPTLIEVPVGPMPSPWEFLQLPRVRGQ